MSTNSEDTIEIPTPRWESAIKAGDTIYIKRNQVEDYLEVLAEIYLKARGFVVVKGGS